jgi:hypothetical protein
MSKITIRIPESLYELMLDDFRRPHDFAMERAGFTFSNSKKLTNGDVIICMNEYNPIDDDDYIEDDFVAAKFNSNCILSSISHGLENGKGIFHTHIHEFSKANPEFSYTDMEHLPPIIESCNRIIQNQVHGLLLLSQTTLNAIVWLPGESSPKQVDQISIIGSSFGFSFPKNPLNELKLNRYNRQSFLGKYAESIFSRVKIGVVGLGGGGSHIVQQLAHLGIKNYALFDYDIVDESNLNRLVGATLSDFEDKIPKFNVACRTIRSLHRDANIAGGILKWELDADNIDSCDIVIGCLDTLACRRDLEAECRKYLIPYIDLGMGIDRPEDHAPFIYGQVHLSVPDTSCLVCRDFLNETDLGHEAEKYGELGGRPQVVWSNGILASIAIGILTDLLMNWTLNSKCNLHLTYEGNFNTIKPSIFSETYSNVCDHYPIKLTGPSKLFSL